MTYDLIIVSQSVGPLIPITQNCIDTALADGAEVNVIVVETSDKIVEYKGCNTHILYEGPFNYNHALNLGIAQAKGKKKDDVLILANNDLIFHPGWSMIGELMKINGYESASARNGYQRTYPCGNYIYDGYMVSHILTGWCIFSTRYCIDKIGGRLDETVAFWYSDDIYACQIKAVGIMHGLFCNVQVDHIASLTLKRQPSRIQRILMIGEGYKFNKRKKYYEMLEKQNLIKEYRNA